MKGSIANIWLLGMVITFIFIFSAYITVTMNYSKAFKFKNEVLTIIEKKHGILKQSGVDSSQTSKIKSGEPVSIPYSALGTINVFLKGSGYSAKGRCPAEDLVGEIWYGVSELTDGTGSYQVQQITAANAKDPFYYCFSKKGRSATITAVESSCSNLDYVPYYYDVVLFYRLEFPLLGDLFTFRVDGTTGDIYKTAKETGAYGCTYV